MAKNEFVHYAELFRGLIKTLRVLPTEEGNQTMIELCFRMLQRVTGLPNGSNLDTRYHYLLINPQQDIVQAFAEAGLEMHYAIENGQYVFVVREATLSCNYQIRLPYTRDVKSFMFPACTTVH
jgi:hypothetical protein